MRLKGPVSNFRNLVKFRFFIFQRFVKRYCLCILDNFVEKRSDGIQYHRVRWYSIPSKFLFHKKCYILFSKHYFPILTHFVQKCFHGIEYRRTFFTQKCKKQHNKTFHKFLKNEKTIPQKIQNYDQIPEF